MADSKALLEGIHVLDLTRVLAGPYCTMMLGDLGADVIKVEAPGRGDDTRGWGPPFAKGGESAYFLSANRNKRSLTLDLKSKKGLAVLCDLVRWADVLVENFKSGTLEGWGLGAVELEAIQPRLIACSITGYGSTGAGRARPGYDFIVQAEGGFMSLTGPEEGEPFRAGVAIADLSAGMYAASAILAALLARERGGGGRRIDISLMDAQISLLSYVASNYLVTGDVPRRFGNAHPNIVPYQAFRARDGYFAFAAGNDLQWSRFCEAVHQPGWTSDARFATNPQRMAHRADLVGALQSLFSQRTVAEWLEVCRGAGVPAGPIRTLDQVFADPYVKEREMVLEAEHPTAGTLAMVGSPFKISGGRVEVRHAPPLLGQHSEEVLRGELGYSEARVQELRASGVV